MLKLNQLIIQLYEIAIRHIFLLLKSLLLYPAPNRRGIKR